MILNTAIVSIIYAYSVFLSSKKPEPSSARGTCSPPAFPQRPTQNPNIKQARSCIGCEAFLEVKIGQDSSRKVKIGQDSSRQVKVGQDFSIQLKIGQDRSRKVKIGPFPFLKISFEPLLSRILEVGEIISFPIWMILFPVLKSNFEIHGTNEMKNIL